MWLAMEIAAGISAVIALAAVFRGAQLRRQLKTVRAENARNAAELARVSRAAEEQARLARRSDAILKNALDGFFILNERYEFVDANDAFSGMVGYSLEELRKLKISDLEVARPSRPIGTSQLGTGLHHIPSTHRHKLGHDVHLESCVIVLREGESRLLVGFARDITERLAGEDALRRSEEKYRHLVQTSQDLIWSTDAEGRWTFVNNAAAAIYGLSPSDMLGRCITEFMTPEVARLDWEMLERVKSGRSAFRHETTHLRANGTAVRLSFNAIPLYDADGRAIGVTGTATDITERIKAEEQIRDMNRRFEALVNEMPLGYVVWDERGQILEWNPAATEIFGFAPAEALGNTLEALILSEKSKSEFEHTRTRLFAERGTSGLTFENRRKGGESFRCEWFNTYVQHPRSGAPCVASMLRDVSEKERLEAQLRQSQKLESLGVLAGGIAHDFNNILVGILGNASIALEHLSDSSTAGKHVQKVISACQRANGLTQRLLTYAGRTDCELQSLDLNSLVAEILDFARSAALKTARVETGLPESLPPVLADSVQVQQVLMNLLINAAEALDGGKGVIRIITRRESLTSAAIAREIPAQRVTPGDYVCLEVGDSGHGMTETQLARIFEPFFTTKLAGRGLGLSAILGIMRAHRGAIFVRSTPGLGTTFRVYFPLADRPVAIELPPTVNASPRSATVLVIDDEDLIREVVQTILESRGMRVLTAADGAAAVATFREHLNEVDAVLLDLNMPGMGGQEVFERLVELRPDIKVLVSSGYAENEAIGKWRNSGLAGFVHKPYTATALVNKLGAVLN